MLTIFTIPKAFRGHNGVIQRNAIKSWTLLNSPCEIILLGDDPGTAEIAAELGLKHIPDIARNEFGTPLISDMFAQAERIASYPLMCYINADIILLDDFLTTTEFVMRRCRKFLLVGRRRDLDITEPIDFANPNWKADLRKWAHDEGKLYSVAGVDHFIFPKGLFGEIPPFAIGRTVWDNWLMFQARNRGGHLVDATQTMTVVHQNHDYSHVSAKAGDAWNGLEAQRNREMAGSHLHVFTLDDATLVVLPHDSGMRLRRIFTKLHIARIRVLHPNLAGLFRFAHVILRPFRRVA
ncbi:hypothetical protein CCAX7_43570 [Capsulimonas corticalis]|uniref:Uncharacterized protein n=1 Tax=Capsulimonas corticalis TaxID=2219043 RepID=A0A402CXE6_9BACT|nr:hypothetical protein [Capsulimonas corticalis]BDI32306.1 hypothetical protein CCAX7_43570 [Capsulimonas corticalis]